MNRWANNYYAQESKDPTPTQPHPPPTTHSRLGSAIKTENNGTVDLYVFRVAHLTRLTLRSLIEHQGVGVLYIEQLSHKVAGYRSFVVTVEERDAPRLLSRSFWPGLVSCRLLQDADPRHNVVFSRRHTRELSLPITNLENKSPRHRRRDSRVGGARPGQMVVDKARTIHSVASHAYDTQITSEMKTEANIKASSNNPEHNEENIGQEPNQLQKEVVNIKASSYNPEHNEENIGQEPNQLQKEVVNIKASSYNPEHNEENIAKETSNPQEEKTPTSTKNSVVEKRPKTTTQRGNKSAKGPTRVNTIKVRSKHSDGDVHKERVNSAQGRTQPVTHRSTRVRLSNLKNFSVGKNKKHKLNGSARKKEGMTDNKRITTGMADNKRISDGTADNKRISDATADNKRISTGTADNKIISDGTADNKIISDGTADNKIISDGTADNKIISDGTADNKIISDGTADNKIISTGNRRPETFNISSDPSTQVPYHRTTYTVNKKYKNTSYNTSLTHGSKYTVKPKATHSNWIAPLRGLLSVTSEEALSMLLDPDYDTLLTHNVTDEEIMLGVRVLAHCARAEGRANKLQELVFKICQPQVVFLIKQFTRTIDEKHIWRAERYFWDLGEFLDQYIVHSLFIHGMLSLFTTCTSKILTLKYRKYVSDDLVKVYRGMQTKMFTSLP